MKMKNMNNMFLMNINPWPMIMSINIFMMFSSFVNMMKKKKKKMFNLSMIMMMTLAMSWWMNLKKEMSMKGHWSKQLNWVMKMCMLLFIFSELMIFMSAFMSYINYTTYTSMDSSISWPPMMSMPSSATLLPLYGSILLLSSGYTVSKTHKYIHKNKKKKMIKNFILTTTLGMLFLDMQMMEYSFSSSMNIKFNETSFSNTFFSTTGLHGSHVMIGLLFLMLSMMFMKKMTNNKMWIPSFELASWYWHFVDIMWLFVFSLLYWMNT